MDKVKLLMEKYNLPKWDAQEVCRILSLKNAESKKRTVKANNLEKWRTIEKAAEWKPKEKIEYLFHGKEGHYHNNHDIKKIKFWINEKDQITIDDPFLLDQISLFIGTKRLSEHSMFFQNPQSKGNPTTNDSLRQLVLFLWDFGTGSSYQRRAFIGRIFAEFLPDFQKCLNSTQHLQKAVSNLFPGKNESDWQEMIENFRNIRKQLDDRNFYL